MLGQGIRPARAHFAATRGHWTGLAAKSQLDKVSIVIRGQAAASFAVRNAGPS